MADINYTLLPGPPLRVRVIGPYSDEVIARFFYGNEKSGVVRDKKDPFLVYLDSKRLVPELKNNPRYSVENAGIDDGKIIVIAGLKVENMGDSAQFLRGLYQNGIQEIDRLARARLGKTPTTQATKDVARWVVQKRNSLKLQIRNAGPELFKKIAEYRNQSKYGNPIGPGYDELAAKLRAKGIPAEAIDQVIIDSVRGTSKGFDASGSVLKGVGIVGEVVGFVLMATQDSPDSLEALPASQDDQVRIEEARLKYGIPYSANIDVHGHLKKSSYLQIDVFDPHAGDEIDQETEEILWWIGVDITYHYQGVTWTVPGR